MFFSLCSSAVRLALVWSSLGLTDYADSMISSVSVSSCCLEEEGGGSGFSVPLGLLNPVPSTSLSVSLTSAHCIKK